MQRNIFDDDPDAFQAFRDLARTFVEREIEPHHEQWEADGQVSREVWLAAGKAGLLGTDVPEEFGGGGVDDFRYNAIIDEELVRAGASGIGFPLQNDVVAPYLLRLANDEQKRRWLPGFCSGEIITAIAMTEPGTGSDLQGIQTTAVRDGSDYIVNGSKTFITNGILSDLVIVVAKTDPDAGSKGFSLIVVERDMPGFERGRRLKKVGMKAQDTAELFFSDVRVPAANVLGEVGQGFIYLMQNLPQERLSIAVGCTAGVERALEQRPDGDNLTWGEFVTNSAASFLGGDKEKPKTPAKPKKEKLPSLRHPCVRKACGWNTKMLVDSFPVALWHGGIGKKAQTESIGRSVDQGLQLDQ